MPNLSKFTIEAIKTKKLNLAEIMEIVKQGITPPGIRVVDDKPVAGQEETPSKLQPKPKPWQMKQRSSNTRRRAEIQTKQEEEANKNEETDNREEEKQNK